MNTRTQVLLGVMLLVVGAWLADQFGLLAFLDPADAGPSELDKIRMQITKAEEIIVQGEQARDVLASFEKRSLPFDPVAARSEYQSWLTRLVEENNVEKAVVQVDDPSSITVKDGDGKNKEAYKRYGFTVSGMGRLDSIIEFLYGFYRAGHLHKITSLSLTPGASGIFNLSVGGEAIGVATCERKSELSTEMGNSLQQENVEDYASIVRRNIFSREGAKTLKQIQLSSITFDKTGQPEAWFQIGETQTNKRLQRNDELQVSVHMIKVIDIQPRSALLELDGQILEITLGQSLDEALSTHGVARLAEAAVVTEDQ